MSQKSVWFWPLASLLVLSDCGTKHLADERLQPLHVPHDVVGDVLRFTLTYNEGAAFSTSFGPASRWVISGVVLVVLGVLWRTFRAAPASDRWQGAALGLVTGGALGNLIDRLRWPGGVVDFIDVGLGPTRFWTFNVADMGVTVGAVMLALAMLRSQQRSNDLQRPPTG